MGVAQMRSFLLAAGLLLLLSTPLTFAQEGEHAERGGRITGTVTNAEGEPIDHAIICKTVVHPHSSHTDCSGTPTDENGRFEIEDVELGEVRLFAEKQQAGYWIENWDAAQQKVILTPEKPLANVTLNAGARPGELRLVVKDKATGKPVDSCKIRIVQGDHTFINSCRGPVTPLRPATDAMIQVSAQGFKNWYYVDPNDPSQPVLQLQSGEQRLLEVELSPTPANPTLEH
jgi:hypothetical protein